MYCSIRLPEALLLSHRRTLHKTEFDYPEEARRASYSKPRSATSKAISKLDGFRLRDGLDQII